MFFENNEPVVPETLKGLYGMAVEASDEIIQFGRIVKKVAGANRDFGPCKFEFNLKEMERAREKLENKYNNDLSLLEDVARCRLTCDSLEQIDVIAKFIEKESVPLRKEDTLQKPNKRGYRDLKYTFVASNGLKMEMQINVREYVRAGDETHPLYEDIRDITELATKEKRELTDEEQKKVNDLGNACKDIYERARQQYNARTKGRKLCKVSTMQPMERTNGR